MGTIAHSIQYRGVPGNTVLAVDKVSGSTSYATGGDTCLAASVGLAKINQAIDIVMVSTSGTSILAHFIPGSSLLQCFDLGPAPSTSVNTVITECTAGTDLHTFSGQLWAMGTF